MASELTLFVNGAKQVVSATPETPLIFVLRNELKLSGPRLGCGMAQCGSCSVLLDGEEVRTCITPVSYAVGKQVTTIEGLPAAWAAEKKLSAADAAKTLHPVQQAWIDEQVPQCGYCQSGMMIAAVELLAKNPNRPWCRSRTLLRTSHHHRISAAAALTRQLSMPCSAPLRP